jgi:hypothetical protein
MKLKIFFCQFPNPWALRVSGMGGYNSKCEKMSKSLHPNVNVLSNECTKSKLGNMSNFCYINNRILIKSRRDISNY